MNLIEDWGEVLSGYVPDLPKSTGRHGERLCLIFYSIGRVEILKNLLTFA